jgi:glutamate carboxypeptidase
MLIARFEGTGTKRILLLAHMDTIYAEGILKKEPFRLDGDRAYGPGIGDDKAGLTNVVHALKLLRAVDFRGYSKLTVLFNSDEEIGSRGSGETITSLAREHDIVLSNEGGGINGQIRRATSGVANLVVEVKGRASHAGSAPEQGRNALVEMASIIMKTLDLSQTEHGLKFNWTLAQAGNVSNAIPDSAKATANIRFINNADFEQLQKTFAERIHERTVAETEVTWSVGHPRPALKPDERNRVLGEVAKRIYAEIGLDLTVTDKSPGGGTDAGYAALASNAAVLEGFALIGAGAHGGIEWIDMRSIPSRLYLLSRMIVEGSKLPGTE